MIATARSTAKPYTLLAGTSQETLFLAFTRYPYLSAEQAATLCGYSPGSITLVRAHLKCLTDTKYLMQLPRLPNEPALYTLAAKGRTYATKLGIDIKKRFHPSEEGKSPDFRSHTLAVNDVLISAELLCQQVPHVVLNAMRHDLDLKQTPVAVTLPDGTKRGVILDGWIDLYIAWRYQVCIGWEIVNRQHIDQKRWRRKVRALLAFEQGPYQQAFAGPPDLPLTIAVATPRGEHITELLKRWTEAELTAMQATHRADLFRFASVPQPHARDAAVYLQPFFVAPFGTQRVPLVALEEVDSS